MASANAEKTHVDSVHFSISGEFITDHYRSLVREGNWRLAMEQLQDSFTREMDAQLAFDILSGKRKLVGTNTVDVVEDDAHLDEQWVKDQYFTYSYNVVFIDRQAYRVYGQVSHLDEGDMKAAREIRHYEGWDEEEFNCLRALTYAKNRYTDKAFFNDDDGWYLAEPASQEFPPWLRQSDIEKLSGKKVFQNFRGLMKLDEREIEEIEEEKPFSVNLSNPFKNMMDSGLAEAASSRLDSFLEESRKADEAFDNLEELRDQIAKLADQKGGWIELHDEENDIEYELPKNAFYRWCLSNSSAWESIDWTPVSPRGMKMSGDDPNHTDWWLFTGHALEDGYNDDYMAFFSEQRHLIHKQLTGHEFTTLLRGSIDGGRATRIARHVDSPDKIYFINRNDLVIIPSASPDFEAVAHKCAELKAVLMTEVGGKLCHLATVGREFGLTLIMLPEARQRLPMGCKVEVDLDKGTLSAKDLDAEDALKLKLSGAMYRN